jgi:hypothetical protein
MEPPRHDDFEPDRLPLERRQAGRIALREIAEWVRAMLERHAKDPVSEITTLDELADFFGDEEEEGIAKKKDENPGGAIIIRERPVKLKSRAVAYGTSGAGQVDGDGEGEEDDIGGEYGRGEVGGEGGGNSGGNGTNSGNGNGAGGLKEDGGSTDRGRRTTARGIPLRDVRAVPLGPTRRRVAFTPTVTGTLTIELQDSGADANYRLDVHEADAGIVKNGRIEQLKVVAGTRINVSVGLQQPFEGTLRVVANAV